MKQEEKTKLTRKKIIDAAVNEFGTNGYEKANINCISASGISKGLIYYNFTNKDDLYIECLKVCFEEITEALDCHEDNSDYSVYFDKRLSLFREKRKVAAMVLEALINPPQCHIEKISEIRKQYDKMNTEWIMNILKKGRLRENVTTEDALRYLALMQDMFNWYCTSPKFAGEKSGDVIEFHEHELSRIFEYMLCGVIKGE